MSYVNQRYAFEKALKAACATVLGTESTLVRAGTTGDERGLPYVRCRITGGQEMWPGSEVYTMNCEATVATLMAEEDMDEHEARCNLVFGLVEDTTRKTLFEASGDLAFIGMNQISYSEAVEGSAALSTVSFDMIGFAK